MYVPLVSEFQYTSLPFHYGKVIDIDIEEVVLIAGFKVELTFTCSPDLAIALAAEFGWPHSLPAMVDVGNTHGVTTFIDGISIFFNGVRPGGYEYPANIVPRHFYPINFQADGVFPPAGT